MAIRRRSVFSNRGFNSAQPPSVPTELATGSLTSGLVAYWPLVSDLRDWTGGQANLTPSGTIPFVTAARGGAASFDGTNKYLSGTPSALPSGTADRTYSLWVDASSAATGPSSLNLYLAHGTDASGGASVLYIYSAADNKLVVGSGTTGVWPGSAGFFAAQNQPVHIVVTSVGQATFAVYMNGVLVTNVTVTAINTSTSSFTLGGTATRGFGMSGKISNVAIFNRAITQAEALQLYLEPFVLRRPLVRRAYMTGVAGAAPASRRPFITIAA
jgi:hypothetical protein